ncbi:hypothetical protein SAI_0663, partial [Streptococcus agalactiae H36B]
EKHKKVEWALKGWIKKENHFGGKSQKFVFLWFFPPPFNTKWGGRIIVLNFELAQVDKGYGWRNQWLY